MSRKDFEGTSRRACDAPAVQVDCIEVYSLGWASAERQERELRFRGSHSMQLPLLFASPKRIGWRSFRGKNVGWNVSRDLLQPRKRLIKRPRLLIRPSEPRLFVHHVPQRRSVDHCAAVVENNLKAALIEVRTIPSHMWRDENIRKDPDWVLRRKRLLLEHVKSCSRDLTRLERSNQIGKACSPTAPDVDEKSSWLHTLEPRS